nr:cyclopropane-fatty-acyl-phospholipid synthase [uncultured Pedobacter sp.]
MEKDRVIKRVGWVTEMKSTPPLTEEYKQVQYRFFENIVKFLQDKGLTTKVILSENEKADDDSEIKVSDLTKEGFAFYPVGIRKWIEKYDKSKEKEKAINDFAFIEKKFAEFKAKKGS